MALNSLPMNFKSTTFCSLSDSSYPKADFYGSLHVTEAPYGKLKYLNGMTLTVQQEP